MVPWIFAAKVAAVSIGALAVVAPVAAVAAADKIGFLKLEVLLVPVRRLRT